MMGEHGMKEIVKKGRTVEEAIDEALSELEATNDDVEIEVLSEGNKGLFGILGGKEAEVRVTLKAFSPTQCAKDFLEELLEKMEIKAEVEVQEKEDRIDINISGDGMGVLIGRRGETLTSLQYLTSLVVNRKTDEYVRISLDTENYKKKREETLVRLANKTAERVVRYGRTITLDPMNPYERRIVHSALQSNEQISTYSTGEEPNRRVVVTYDRGRS